MQAIRDWVRDRTLFPSNSSNSNTSAMDTLLEPVGVCRDFAHLMIALCRALNIPARFTTGIDYGADPALGPPRLPRLRGGLPGRPLVHLRPVRHRHPDGLRALGTGRDAADVAFATIFGPVISTAPLIGIRAVPASDGRLYLPEHTTLALSTDAAPAA